MATDEVAQQTTKINAVTLTVSALVENRREFFRLLLPLEDGRAEIDVGTLTSMIDVEYADRTSVTKEEAHAILRAVREEEG